MKNTLIEVSAESYQDCMAAYYGGAHRVLLSNAISLGGLTPTVAVLDAVKKGLDIEVVCLVRPRLAGFSYDECDREIMMDEAKRLLEAGADGIAFGFLERCSKIEKENTIEMVKLIHSYNAKAVFNGAFDLCESPHEAIEELIECGVDRVMTSGQKKTALEGKELIKDLCQNYADKIEIVACRKVEFSNAQELIDYTHVKQILTNCTGYMKDPTTNKNEVSYSYLSDDHHSDYGVVCEGLVIKLIEEVL